MKLHHVSGIKCEKTSVLMPAQNRGLKCRIRAVGEGWYKWGMQRIGALRI